MGNLMEALAILKPLIRQTPNAFEPWLTAGTIYEEQGETIKSQGALFMAAYLNDTNADLWKKLAKQSVYLI
jgi:cytochrome c-type biogenesis protein CcmH/NrfG